MFCRFLDPTRKWVLTTLPASRDSWALGSTAVLLPQQYYSRSSTYSTRLTDPPTHRPTMYSSVPGRKTAVLILFFHAERDCIAASFWDFLSYTMRRHIGRRGRFLSTLPASLGLALGLAYKILCRVV